MEQGDLVVRGMGYSRMVIEVLLSTACWCMLAVNPCAAASSATEEWVRRYGLNVFDNAKAIAVDAAGNAYVTG